MYTRPLVRGWSLSQRDYDRVERICSVTDWCAAPQMHVLFCHSLTLHYMFGGVAQWLGRWSLAGGLSLICAWSMVVMRPLRG